MKKSLLFASLSVAIAAAASSASAATITIACGAVGQELEQCRTGAEAWAKATGNQVKILQSPNLTNDRLGLYQQQLAARSADVDVYQLDVIWPGLLSQHFVDLKQYIKPADIKQHFPAIVENNTINGKLTSIPWFTDAGLLYYRTDLLKKYGYNAPPKTWDELQAMAKKILAGERGTNRDLQGFVYQAKNYEGLTCDALEWVSSYGGGSIVDPKGNITINNAKAKAALTEAASWIGDIAPTGVTTYGEEEARGVFQAGNSIFMRNWPYAWSLGQSEDSKIKGLIGVAPLPAGPGGKSAACLGGWQLGVSNYSKNKAAAADLVRYLTSPAEQKRRAIAASYNPTIPALYRDKEVLAAVPFFGSLYDVFTNAVPRPSSPTGDKYNQVSNAFSTATYNVLTKKQTADQALTGLEQQLRRIKGRNW